MSRARVIPQVTLQCQERQGERIKVGVGWRRLTAASALSKGATRDAGLSLDNAGDHRADALDPPFRSSPYPMGGSAWTRDAIVAPA